MPWIRKMFKGIKVYTWCDQQGRPLVKHGKVTIKYRQDDKRTYQANAWAVSEIDPSKLKKRKRSQRSSVPCSPNSSQTPSSSAPLLAETCVAEVKPQLANTAPPSDFSQAQASRPSQAPPDQVKGEPTDCITVYTDGACSGNPGPAGIGIVLSYQGHRKEISRSIGTGTNNIAELTAIETALQAIKDPQLPVRLYTDSSYCIGMLVHNWKARENVELVERIRTLMESFSDLEIIKIKGHAGHPENERADQLAKAALQSH